MSIELSTDVCSRVSVRACGPLDEEEPRYKAVFEGKDVSKLSELLSVSGNVVLRFRRVLSLVFEVLEVLDLMPGRNRKNDPALHSFLDLVQFEQGRLVELPIGDCIRMVTISCSNIKPILAFQMTTLTCLAVSYVSSTHTRGRLQRGCSVPGCVL